MKILNSYLAKRFYKTLALFVLVFFTIYLVIDFVQKLDNFIGAGVDKFTILRYFVYESPYILLQIIPPSVLLSLIVMTSIMKKYNEILAIKISGINVFSIYQVILVCVIFLTAFVFILSEFVAPYATSKSRDIWKYEVEKHSRGQYYGSDQVWYKGENRIYWIKHYDYKNRLLLDATFYFFDDDFRLVKKIDGTRGEWQDGRWILESGLIQTVRPDGSYKLERFDEHVLDIPETPETFVKERKSPEELSFWKMKRYAEQVQSEGYENTKYLVDMHIKIAYPVILVIMMVIGLSIPLMQKQVRIPTSVMVGILLCFLYMVILGFSRSLGLSGMLPPVLAAWLSNLVFLLLGAYMMGHVRR